jgi:hypothetical protein
LREQDTGFDVRIDHKRVSSPPNRNKKSVKDSFLDKIDLLVRKALSADSAGIFTEPVHLFYVRED